MVDEVSVPRFTEEDDFPETIAMYQNGWPPTGGPINIAADQGLLNWPLRDLANRTRNLKNRIDDMALRAASLVTVGPGGDYATINSALSELSERRPGYVSGGFQTELRLLSGFTMAEQVLVSAVNLGWITITSDEPEVLIDRAALTASFGDEMRYPAFSASDGGILPRIGSLFNMTAAGTATDRVGISVSDGGFVTIRPGAGVRNAATAGLVVRTSGGVAANDSIFTNAGTDAVDLAGGTRVTLQNADLRNAVGYGMRAWNGAQVHCFAANFSGAGSGGIYAYRGANVNARGANARRGVSDGPLDFIVEDGSTITANNGTGGTNQAVNTLTANGIIYK